MSSNHVFKIRRNFNRSLIIENILIFLVSDIKTGQNLYYTVLVITL